MNQFAGTTEFEDFKGIMRKHLAALKAELERIVQVVKAESQQAGSLNTAGH